MSEPNVVTADNREMVVDLQTLAACSTTIRESLGEATEAGMIPLAVKSTVLEKVLQYCREKRDHPDAPIPESDKYRTDNISAWDQEFMKALDMEMLFSITLAANHLDIKNLLDLSLKTMANLMKGKNAEEIQAIFKMPDNSELARTVQRAA